MCVSASVTLCKFHDFHVKSAGLSLVVPSHFVPHQLICAVLISEYVLAVRNKALKMMPNGTLLGTKQKNAIWHYWV